jgi:hypothetical protein
MSHEFVLLQEFWRFVQFAKDKREAVSVRTLSSHYAPRSVPSFHMLSSYKELARMENLPQNVNID